MREVQKRLKGKPFYLKSEIGQLVAQIRCYKLFISPPADFPLLKNLHTYNEKVD